MITQESTERSSHAQQAAEELWMATDLDSFSVKSQQSITYKITDRQTLCLLCVVKTQQTKQKMRNVRNN